MKQSQRWLGMVMITAALTFGALAGPVAADPQTDSSGVGTTAPAGVYNVRDYGAVGDGKADDLPAIQKALAAIISAGGGSLYFPKGTYQISDRVEFPGQPNGVHVYGDGDASVLKHDTATQTAHADMLYFRNISGVTVDHLRFEGAHVFDKESNWGAGVSLFHARDTRVHSCTFYGTGFALFEADDVQGTIFTDNQVLDWGRVGYFVEGHCQVENNLFQQTDPGPDFDPHVSSHGMYIHSNAQEVTVSGNTFRGIRYNGIQIYGTDANALTKDILIQNNTFENNAVDIDCRSAPNSVAYDNIQVLANHFRDTHGGSVYLGKGTNLEISDNLFVDCGNPNGIAIHMGAYDSSSLVRGGKILRNTIFRTRPGDTQGIDLGTLITENIEVRGNWIAMSGRKAIYTNRITNAVIADNVIWMTPDNGDNDWAWGMQIDELSFNIQITGNEVYGTGTGHARGIEPLTNPTLSSGRIDSNFFYGAPLDPGPLTLTNNVVADLTGKPVTNFALADASSDARDKTAAKTVRVTIDGGDDAVAWLLSETQVHMPAADDPAWQTTKPTTFTLSDGNQVKRVLLWRKLADGTVSNRPEVATIELALGG